MNLIAIKTAEIGKDKIETVNARELHAFLESRDHFSTWIQSRIEQYQFTENMDFLTFSESTEKGRPRKEYAISIDMAKELSMVERNEKGKQARKYFIECERQAKQGIDPAKVLNDPSAMRGLLLVYTERVLELEETVEEQKPVIEAYDRIAKADGSMCVTDAAKTLQHRPKDLFTFLRSNGWTYRRPGGGADIAYQAKLVSGLLEHKVTTVHRSDGTEKVTTQVRVTPKGLAHLAKVFPSAAEAA